MELEMVIRDLPELRSSRTEDSKNVAKLFPDAVATTKSLTNLSMQCQITFRLKHLRGKASHLSFSTEKHIRCAMKKAQNKYDIFTDFHGFKSLDIKNFNYKKDGRAFECKSFSDFLCLTELNLINLNMHNIEVDIGLLQELQKLDLSGNDFPDLPKEMEKLSTLKSLRLTNFRILRDLPELTQLKTLALSDCINLRSFPHERRYHFLQNLWLDNCRKVQNLSDTLSKCLNLTYLDLSRNDFGTLPASIKLLSSLGTLCLSYCNNLESLTDLPLSLKYVHAKGCKSLKTVDLPLGHCIRHLDLSYCPKLNEVEHLTKQFIKCGRNEEVSQRFACLPGDIVPSYFDCKTTSLPHIWHTVESVGFSACIMIACESPYHLQLSSSSYNCKKEGNRSYTLNLKPEFSIPSESTTEGGKFLEHHMFIFHVEEDVHKLHLRSHLELSKEFQFTLEESISYRVRVVHTTQEEDPEHGLSCGDLHPNGNLEADSVDYFKDGQNKKVQPLNDCLEETEMPSYVLGNQQTSETGFDSLEADSVEIFKRHTKRRGRSPAATSLCSEN